MAINPRIDDLRKRLDKDPGSRLFAQLAEELRKEGDLDEAVRVARDGLARHPAYPSARMTLGRALLDQGDVTAARVEFEEVLKSAADNILASRFLGECLEAEGDLTGALARHDQTLVLAPGDAVLAARRRAVQERLAEASRVAAHRASSEAAIPVVEADEPMEVEIGHASPSGLPPLGARTAASMEAPIPVSQVEGEFELEQASEAPASRWEAGERKAPAEPEREASFEFEDASGVIPEASASQPVPSPESEAQLTSPTLAELYFSQGFPEKALEVYRALLQRDPADERLQARAGEIENRLRGAGFGPEGGSAVDDAKATRREAVQRTIGKLERFLASTRREAR